jgi:hypothetical protein
LKRTVRKPPASLCGGRQLSPDARTLRRKKDSVLFFPNPVETKKDIVGFLLNPVERKKDIVGFFLNPAERKKTLSVFFSTRLNEKRHCRILSQPG